MEFQRVGQDWATNAFTFSLSAGSLGLRIPAGASWVAAAAINGGDWGLQPWEEVGEQVPSQSPRRKVGLVFSLPRALVTPPVAGSQAINVSRKERDLRGTWTRLLSWDPGSQPRVQSTHWTQACGRMALSLFNMVFFGWKKKKKFFFSFQMIKHHKMISSPWTPRGSRYPPNRTS